MAIPAQRQNSSQVTLDAHFRYLETPKDVWEVRLVQGVAHNRAPIAPPNRVEPSVESLRRENLYEDRGA
jgi:hypothetical protein